VGDDAARDACASSLARLAVGIGMAGDGFGLYSGLAGSMWSLVHASDTAVAEEDLDVVAEALISYLRNPHWFGHFDLINGLTGLAVYAAELPSSSSARALLAAVSDQLAAMARTDVDGVYWWTPPELLPDHQQQRHPKGHVDLGVAHGVPGVLWALGAAAQAGIATGRQLLDRAVPWLLSQRLDGDVAFGYTTTLDDAVEPARLAWCYGDVGVAATLMATAQMADRDDWRVEAAALAHRAAHRPEATSAVVDPGLCHGAAGVGHLFRRLYDATGDPSMGEASARWLDVARAMPPPENPGFLNGPVGVELALLAGASDVDPSWDRLLLASPAPRPA
jgi:lantibiotic biosynthesis protein